MNTEKHGFYEDVHGKCGKKEKLDFFLAKIGVD
jgi:hypothetical protein